MRCSAGCEDGFASIVVVAGIAVLLLVFGGAVAVSDLVATGSRAGTAADLAALASARAAASGSGAACERAAAIAAANRARLQSCRIGPGQAGSAGPFDADVVVTAAVLGPMRAVASWLGLAVPEVRARALAGPPR